MSPVPDNSPNFQSLTIRGQDIYNTLEEQFKEDNKGKYIAIEVQLEADEYFVGNTRDEAVKMAKDKYPDKLVFVRRIGNLENLSRHVRQVSRV